MMMRIIIIIIINNNNNNNNNNNILTNQRILKSHWARRTLAKTQPKMVIWDPKFPWSSSKCKKSKISIDSYWSKNIPIWLVESV